MLTTEELVALARRLEGTKTLTAYVPVAADTPQPRTASRTLLKQGIARVRESLADAPREERAQFDDCAKRLVERAEKGVHRQGGGTWVGFAAAADNEIHDETLPVLLPALVAWEDGPRIVPYLAAADATSALVVALDQQRATFFLAERGNLTEIERFETESGIDETGPHMSAPSKQGFHTGEHGEPGKDAAARVATNTFKRHRSKILGRIRAHDDPTRWVVLGGPVEALTQVTSGLPVDIVDRMGVAGTMTPGSPLPVIQDAAAATVQQLRVERQKRIVAELLDGEPSPDLSALGIDTVDSALTQRTVGMLVVADEWQRNHGTDAEQFARRAMAQDATVELVSGEAASALIARAGGVAARLRFPMPVAVGTE